MVAKPNKPISIVNIRLISFTSCTGRLYEHMVNERLTIHLEDNGHYPNTMFGFRQTLSTEDVLLQINEDYLFRLSKHSKSSVLALDVKGTFDNVSHEALLYSLEDVGCGAKTYAYLLAFLNNRTATVGIANIRSELFQLPNNGTPRGSVISPLLFNLALLKLPRLMDAVPGIHHALYADDVTMWTIYASTSEQEDRLQEVVNISEEYLKTGGLQCAPEKLKLLGARTRGRPPS